MIYLAICYYLAVKKLSIFALKFDYFAISQYSDFHLKEINIVQKWPRQSCLLKEEQHGIM